MNPPAITWQSALTTLPPVGVPVLVYGIRIAPDDPYAVGIDELRDPRGSWREWDAVEHWAYLEES